MSATVIISGIIALTDDNALRQKLLLKVEEYERRYTVDTKDFDAYYKMRLLRELLQTSVLDAAVIEREFIGMPWHDRKLFENALAVIAHYNGDVSGITRGGTGLR